MLENIKNLKFGYTPYSEDYSMPSDRRRFVGYARHRGLDIETADINKDYDIVFLTYHGDLYKWIQKKKRAKNSFKLIFELQDFYFAEPFTFKSLFRGFAKYITGKSSKFYLDYKKLLKEACIIADVVVCTTEEQKQSILTFNDNVHICLDYFEDEIQVVKTDYSLKNEKLKLVWEGQSLTLFNLLVLKDTLNSLKDEVELHVVTDRYFYRYANKYGKKTSSDILKSITCDKYFYDWQKKTFNQHIINCDLAVIPIDRNNGLQNGKPENKLILFWLMGMPVLASSTPAYKRIMNKSDIKLHIDNLEMWKHKILDYKQMLSDNRASIGIKCFNFAKVNYNKEYITLMWDKILI